MSKSQALSRARTRQNSAVARTKFIDALRTTGIVETAAQAAKIARRTAYAWRDTDESFRAAWAEALEESTDALEQEAYRRAVDGSDTLLIFLLKARRPNVYRETYRIGANANKDGTTIVFEIGSPGEPGLRWGDATAPLVIEDEPRTR